MNNKSERGQTSDNRQLRSDAEERVARCDGIDSKLATFSIERLLHELQVHRIELEMQNESLREAEAEVARARDRYIDLYDFAPVGYFTVNLAGVLTEANLMSAQLFGYSRADLIGKHLLHLICGGYKDRLRSLLADAEPRCLRHAIPEICLLHRDGSRFFARFDCLYKRSQNPLTEESTLRISMINLGALSAAERDSQEKESHYRTLYESMRDAFVLVDMAGKLLVFNKPYQEMLGYSADDLKNKTYLDLTPEKWHSFEAGLVQSEVLPDGESRIYEKEYIRADKTVFPVELKTVLLKNHQGQPEGMWAVVRDISQRKQAEADLVASESRFRLAMQAITGFIYDWNIAKGELFVSEGVSDFFGRRPASSKNIANWLCNFVHPEDFSSLQAQIVQSWKKQDARFQTLFRIINTENDWLHVSSRALFEYDPQGRAVRMVGSCSDVSRQVKAELALRQLNDSLEEQVMERGAELRSRLRELHESESFTRTTLNAISAALIVVDENGCAVLSNRAWKKLTPKQAKPLPLSCKAEDFVGLPCGRVCQEHAAACLANNKINKAISVMLLGKRKSQTLECEMCAGLAVRWFLVRMTRFQGGKALRLVITYSDITERKLAADDLLRVAKNFKSMLRNVELSHEQKDKQLAREIHDELGATLTMLKLGLATSKNTELSSAFNTKIDGMIVLANLALQSAKRVTACLRPSMLDTLGLAAAIKWHVKDFERMTGIHVMLILPESLSLVGEHENAVFRVIQEALTNVAKHAEAGEVIILLRQTKRQLAITVSDNGKGVLQGSLQKNHSFGVIGMQERARHMGGKLSLAARPEGGSVLTLKIPIPSIGGQTLESASVS